MKISGIQKAIRTFAAPALMCLLGLCLLLRPDSASALVGKLLGWGCVLGALSCAFAACQGRPGQVLPGIGLGAAGVFLLLNPLLPAMAVSRLLGLFLLFQGGRDLWLNRQPRSGASWVLPLLTAVLGLVLILMPMSVARLVLRIAGGILVFLGAGEIWNRIRGRKRLTRGDDDIVDGEKL